MHIVFTVPELLQHFFSHLDRNEIKPIVTVNQQWSASALDVLWAEVDSFWQVCHVLAPMEEHSESGEYHFSRPLTPDDWVRFDRYADRVQRLHHPLNLDRYLAPSVFDQLARTRLRMDIFPNLRKVSWNFRLLDSVLVMHRGLRSLVVELSNVRQEEVNGFFSHLVSRSPDLSELCIKGVESDVCVLDVPLMLAFTKLLNLREVSLPFPPSRSVFDAMSCLPGLQSVVFGHSSTSVPEVTFVNGAFPFLESIALSFSYERSASILTKLNLPLLSRICLNSPRNEPPASLIGLLSVISTRFPGLIALRLTSARTFIPVPVWGSVKDDITLADLRPLLKCVKLRSFEIHHHRALDLLPWELEEITTALPHLETLILNCSPPNHIRDSSQLGISVLERLAAGCPNLKRLGLYLNPSSPRSQIPPAKFLNLQSLYVGASVISNVHAAASFLSYICPYVKTVITGRGWMQPAPEASGFADESWKEVATLLPLLLDIRAEERALARRGANNLRIVNLKLESEIESLQLRIAHLEGSTDTETSDKFSIDSLDLRI